MGDVRSWGAAADADRTWIIPVQNATTPFETSYLTFTQLFALEVALRAYPIELTELRVHDNLIASLPGAAAADDLGIVPGTFGTDAVTLQTTDSKAATQTLYGRVRFVVPYTYNAAATITLRVNAGMLTTVSDTTATLDVECYRNAAPSVDINATAATTINSLTAADVDFTITPTNVVPGDILDIRFTIAIVDSATGTAVIGKANSITFLMDSTN